MLYGRHLGFRGDFEKQLAAGMQKLWSCFEGMEEVKAEAAKWMKVKAVWQFFEAEAEGEALHCVYGWRRSAAAHVEPQAAENGRPALLERLCAACERRKERSCSAIRGNGGRRSARTSRGSERTQVIIFCRMLQALAIEAAEACAEWLHRRIREDWGFPDPVGITMGQRFTSRYRGKRYSFGYPACPELADQAGIWKAAETGGNWRGTDRGLHDGP